MALFARLYDFTVAALRKSSEMNAEFDNIINLFNGVDTNKRIHIRTENTLPALIVEQNGDGPIFQAKRAGVLKVSIESNGQLKSHIATGTAPLAVSNGTKVTNLNVDLLDGLNANQLLGANSELSQSTPQFFTGTPSIGDKKYFAIEGIRLTKIKIQQQNSSATSDAQIQLRFFTDEEVPETIGDLTLTGTSTAVNSVVISDFDLSGIDRIYCEVMNIIGTTKHNDITVCLVTEQITVNPA